jgi:MoxR-like ATPase
MVQASREVVEALIRIRREVALEHGPMPSEEVIRRELGTRSDTALQDEALFELGVLLQRATALDDHRRDQEVKGLRTLTELDKQLELIDRTFLELAHSVAHERRSYTRSEIVRRDELLRQRETCLEEKTSILTRDPDAFLAYHGQSFNRYGEQLRAGKLVQTPYVDEKLQELLTALRRNYYTLLHGDTGSGKTELAKLAGRILSKEIHRDNPPGGKHEPLLIRCYRGMGAEELFGHFALKRSNEGEIHDLPERIETQVALWNERNPNASSEQRERATRNITEALVKQTGCTISEYIFGALYRAAKLGIVVILDEVNFAPPEMLVKLNEFLNLGPGELVHIQEDTIEPFPMHPGFGLICTGNVDYGTSKRYGSGRFDFEPSRLNRLTILNYDYLPQAIKGTCDEVQDTLDKQLYTIALASLVGDSEIASLPEGSLERLWDLCKYARLTQIAFSGQLKRDNEYALQSGGTPIEHSPEVLISPRNLVRILKDWTLDGYRFELDHYLYKHFICSALKPADGALLYQLAKKLGFFQNRWPAGVAEIEKVGAGFVVRDPLNPGPNLQYYHRSEIIRTIYGPGPIRRDYGSFASDDSTHITDEERLEIANELLLFEDLRAQAMAATEFLQGHSAAEV